MKRQALKLTDVRAVFRLLGEARELRWSSRQGAHLVDGLARLLGAERGFGGSLGNYVAGAEPVYRSIVLGSQTDPALNSYFQMLGSQLTAADDPMVAFGCLSRRPVEAITHRRLPAAYFGGRFSLFHSIVDEYDMRDNLTAWYRHTGRASEITGFAVHRLGRSSRAFTERERRVAMFFMKEYGRMREEGLLSPPAAVSRLSTRERQVFDRLLAGEAPKQIAAHLALSIHTVRDHLKSIYAKLGIEGSAGLLRLVSGVGNPVDP